MVFSHIMMYDYVFYQMLVLVKRLLSHHNLSCIHIYPHTLLKLKKKDKKKAAREMSVGWGDHFLPHKYIKNSSAREETTTRKLLNAGGGTQIPREMHGPSGTAPSWCTWDPDWPGPGMCTRHMAHLWWYVCGTHGSLPRLGPGLAHNLELWQPQCGPSTGSTPHTCRWCLLVVSVCLHSTTEQGSLNKWPLLPTHVRAEIRHWRELQSEEGKENKERKGNRPGSIRCNRLKPCS